VAIGYTYTFLFVKSILDSSNPHQKQYLAYLDSFRHFKAIQRNRLSYHVHKHGSGTKFLFSIFKFKVILRSNNGTAKSLFVVLLRGLQSDALWYVMAKIFFLSKTEHFTLKTHLSSEF
jgi:hypothetical protein